MLLYYCYNIIPTWILHTNYKYVTIQVGILTEVGIKWDEVGLM